MESNAILAVSALLVSIMTAIGTLYAQRLVARKDELQRLDERCDELEEMLRQEAQYKILLLEHVSQLRRLLIEAGIKVPPFPIEAEKRKKQKRE